MKRLSSKMKKMILTMIAMTTMVTELSAENPSSFVDADKLICKVTHTGEYKQNQRSYDMRPLSDMQVWWINAKIKDDGKTIVFNPENTMKYKTDSIGGSMLFSDGKSDLELDDKTTGKDGESTFYTMHLFLDNAKVKSYGSCLIR